MNASLKEDSPKTPGGISKTLLTPCRRVGLSRNWRNKGNSPFISPLCGSSKLVETNEEPVLTNKGTKKRKECMEEDQEPIETTYSVSASSKKIRQNIKQGDVLEIDVGLENNTHKITGTPLRNVELPRKKKSQTLISVINKEQSPNTQVLDRDVAYEKCNVGSDKKILGKGNINDSNLTITKGEISESVAQPVKLHALNSIQNKSQHDPHRNIISSVQTPECVEIESDEQFKCSADLSNQPLKEVSKPVKKLSRCKSTSFNSPINSTSDLLKHEETNIKESIKLHDNRENKSPEVATLSKKNSKRLKRSHRKCPNKLTKECVVVIQKKLFKADVDKLSNNTDENTASQELFDSDNDDVPLSVLNQKDNSALPESNIEDKTKTVDVDGKSKENNVILATDNETNTDDEFTTTKVSKLQHKNTSTTDLARNSRKKLSNKNNTKQPLRSAVQNLSESGKTSSQESHFDDDDDDFAFETKKTILIRKSYDKISKPSKAKSTGSITQRDIDELKARIEMKKKILLAKSMGKDTEELRVLIKKWQIGCQNALIELMELMKCKFPEKQNMDYSEMLELLQIPPALVGYDSDNDCFNPPDDAELIFSKYN